MDALALGQVWGSILMRPKEGEEAKAVADAAALANAIRLLISRCKCGGAPEFGGDAAGMLLWRSLGLMQARLRLSIFDLAPV